MEGGGGGEYQGKTDSVCVCVTHVWTKERKAAHDLMLPTSPCKKTRGTRGKTGGKMKNKNDRQTCRWRQYRLIHCGSTV